MMAQCWVKIGSEAPPPFPHPFPDLPLVRLLFKMACVNKLGNQRGRPRNGCDGIYIDGKNFE